MPGLNGTRRNRYAKDHGRRQKDRLVTELIMTRRTGGLGISPDAFDALMRAWLWILVSVLFTGCGRRASGESAAPRLRADLLTKTLWKTRSVGDKEIQVLFNPGANGEIRCRSGKGEQRFDFIYKIQGHDQIIRLRLDKERGTAKLTEDSRLSFKIGPHDYLLEPEARP
jgi:hypothetical protein